MALLPRGYKQVVGQGVAAIDSWHPPFPHGHHSRAIQKQTAIREGNGRRQGPCTPQGRLPLLPTLKLSAMPDGSSPAASYCIVRPVEVKWKALNHDVLSLD